MRKVFLSDLRRTMRSRTCTGTRHPQRKRRSEARIVVPAELLGVRFRSGWRSIRFDVTLRKRQECRPVWGSGVSGAVLAERDIAVDQRGLHVRHIGGSQIFLAEQPVDWARAYNAEKHAFRIDPTTLYLE